MKVLLYYQDYDKINNSGIGRAQKHQTEALKRAGVEITYDPSDTYDLAHVNTLWSKSERVARACKKKGIPLIVHGHSTHEDWRESFRCWKIIEPYFDRQLDTMYSLADLIITPTPYSKKLIEGYNLGAPVISISNGINPKEYERNEEDIKLFKERFHIADKERFVMGVGFPFIRKGLDDFFEVARRFPDIKFIWFGHLPAIAQSLDIRREIRHKPDNVLMPGYISGGLIKASYHLASCMFFPSREETEGIVTLEALACKTPLLVRSIGVYDPWLKDGYNCHMGKNVDEFASILSSLLEMGDNQEILENGYKTAEERSLDKIGIELKKAYEDLLKSKNK